MIFFCGPKHFNEFMFEELPKLGYVKDHHFIKRVALVSTTTNAAAPTTILIPTDAKRATFK